MESPMDEKALLIDCILTHDFIESISQPGWNVLNRCGVSLLRFPSRNALLITCYSDDFIPPTFYAQLKEIAKFIHQVHGRTHICLRHHQKDVLMRWNSEDL